MTEPCQADASLGCPPARYVVIVELDDGPSAAVWCIYCTAVLREYAADSIISVASLHPLPAR